MVDLSDAMQYFFYDEKCPAKELKSPYISPSTYFPLTENQKNLVGISTFDAEKPITWVKGYQNGKGEVPYYVPTDLVFVGQNKYYIPNEYGLGVAKTKSEAEELAISELISADALLTSWYKKSSPCVLRFETLPKSIQKFGAELTKKGKQPIILEYDSLFEKVVAAIVLSDSFPYYAFGVANTYKTTYEKSIELALTRAITSSSNIEMRFGEIMSTEQVITKDDHIFYYQNQCNIKKLDWLWKTNVRSKSYSLIKKKSPFKISDLEIILVNITVPNTYFYTVKAFSKDLVPMSFHYALQHYTHENISKEHLDAENIFTPHPFY